MKRSAHNYILVFILTFILSFGLTTPAVAQGLVTGDTIPAGTVLDHDAILVGQDVSIDGTVNGNVFILGNQVTVNGTVDGSIILIGQNARIGGTVTGGVYAATLTLDLASQASIDRDLYVVTVSLTSGSQSLIGRDLYAIGLDSGLSGRVGRDLHTVIGPIQLYNRMMTLLGYDNLTIKLHIETPQPQTNPSGVSPSPIRHARQIVPAAAEAAGFDWGGWALNLLRTWAVLFVFGLLVLRLFPKPLKKTGEVLLEHPWQAIGSGFLGLVAAFLLLGTGLLACIMIFTVGLGLNFLGLWQLSLLFWVAGYASLALAFAALWFFIAYVSKLIVLVFAANWLSESILQRSGYWIKALALLAATAVFVLLRSIPYIGWVLELFIVAAGVGAAWRACRHSRLDRQLVPVEAAPAVTRQARPSAPKTKKASTKTE